jgi:hypothetical protein
VAKNDFLKRFGIVRNAIGKDILFFALPAIIVFYMEMWFCARDGLSDFWGTIWELIKQPQDLLTFPAHSIIGLALIIPGFIFFLSVRSPSFEMILRPWS